MWAIGRWVAALVLVAVAAVAGWMVVRDWRPSAVKYPVQGLDVSAASGTVDWNAVSANGADFAYAVATRGRDRDAVFETNWAGIAAAGLRRGAIHTYSLCLPARDQANAFNTLVPRDPAALPAALGLAPDPACDAHPDRATLVAELTRFLTMVEAHTGKPMLLKIARPIEREYRLSEALPRPLWAMSTLIAPAYMSRPWRMWQANPHRRIEGIEGPINWDVAAP